MGQEVMLPTSPVRLFDASPWLTRIAVVLIMLVGLALRLYDLDDPPLDFHTTRQMHSALIARGIFYADLETVPDWQRERAVQQQRTQGLIEPQVMESLTAFTYRLVGSADLRIPRLYAILFWSLGGVGLFLLNKDLAGSNASVVALLLYMTLPYGVIASRAFQPDPLMSAMLVWSWWGMARWLRHRTWGWAFFAGISAGLAIYIKSTALFFVLGAWVGLLLAGLGIRAVLRERQVWLITGLSLLPYVIYHIYATFGIGLLQDQFSLRFFPGMWLDPVFYLRWQLKAAQVVALPWLVIGVMGLFLLRDKAWRGLLTGAWLGYGIYALLFSYYISTHDYYHLPLIPLAAIGVGLATQVLFSALNGPRLWINLVIPALLLALLLSHSWEARTILKQDDYRPVVRQVEQISAMFNPQDKIVSLAEDYSTRLRYWGWLDTAHWFGSGDFELRELAGQPVDLLAYFEQQTSGKDYFLITDFVELERQPALKQLLDEQYPIIFQGEGYWVYDLRTK
jgi:4-amino-4-deoxy-L-arabinose transferase-like glycosyltransferase